MIGVASNLHNILLKINRRTFLPIDSGQNLTKLLQKIQGYHFFSGRNVFKTCGNNTCIAKKDTGWPQKVVLVHFFQHTVSLELFKIK